MKLDEAYIAMENGHCVRRPNWTPGWFMRLNQDDIEETMNDRGKILCYGYREFHAEIDYEIVPIDDIAKVLQNYCDDTLGLCNITVGVGDDTIFLYEHSKNCKLKTIPEWAQNFKIESRFIGKTRAT